MPLSEAKYRLTVIVRGVTNIEILEIFYILNAPSYLIFPTIDIYIQNRFSCKGETSGINVK